MALKSMANASALLRAQDEALESSVACDYMLRSMLSAVDEIAKRKDAAVRSAKVWKDKHRALQERQFDLLNDAANSKRIMRLEHKCRLETQERLRAYTG